MRGLWLWIFTSNIRKVSAYRYVILSEAKNP